MKKNVHPVATPVNLSHGKLAIVSVVVLQLGFSKYEELDFGLDQLQFASWLQLAAKQLKAKRAEKARYVTGRHAGVSEELKQRSHRSNL